MKKIHGQEYVSVMYPPSVGPSTGATTVAIVVSANAWPRFSGGKVSTTMACWLGCSPPPKNPCSKRNRISSSRLLEIPHRKEQTVKPRMQIVKYRFRPSTVDSQPEIVSTMPLATRYDVSAQVASS